MGALTALGLAIAFIASPLPPGLLDYQKVTSVKLLDRQGRILWREQGATDVTLARMDRFIAKNLNLPAPDAQLAVGPHRAGSKN